MVTEGIQSQLSESFGAAAMPFRTLEALYANEWRIALRQQDCNKN